MFRTNLLTHEILHEVRQEDLEAKAQHHRFVANLKTRNVSASSLRQKFGRQLIALGEKLTHHAEREIQPVWR